MASSTCSTLLQSIRGTALVAGTSFRTTFTMGTVVVTQFSDAACATATTPTLTYDSGCCVPTPVGSGTGTWGGFTCPGKCFHENTTITYNNHQFSLAQLQNHAECHIPHIVNAVGTVLTAKCGGETKILRVTPGHLVYTQRGLQAAGDLTSKDTMYADHSETHSCQVVSIMRDNKEAKYFGLNCFTSEVLADGLKVSCFEKLHSIPSFWMSIMGRILGIKRASAIGDHIEQIVSWMNLI